MFKKQEMKLKEKFVDDLLKNATDSQAMACMYFTNEWAEPFADAGVPQEGVIAAVAALTAHFTMGCTVGVCVIREDEDKWALGITEGEAGQLFHKTMNDMMIKMISMADGSDDQPTVH